MQNLGPLVQSYGNTSLQNLRNLREVDPEQDQSRHNSQNTGHMNFVVPQYQFAQEPMLPSVSYCVHFSMGFGVYRVIIERALANSD